MAKKKRMLFVLPSSIPAPKLEQLGLKIYAVLCDGWAVEVAFAEDKVAGEKADHIIVDDLK